MHYCIYYYLEFAFIFIFSVLIKIMCFYNFIYSGFIYFTVSHFLCLFILKVF